MGKSTNPELSPAVADLMERFENAAPQPLDPRDRAFESGFAVPILAVAIAIAVGFQATRSFALGTTVALVAAYIAARRIRFAVGPSYTVPSQLVFVPMLFLLPTPIVPLVTIVATLLSVVPDLITRRRHPDRLITVLGDSAWAIPPTLVLLVAGTQTASLSHWPIFVAALAAQLVFDTLFAAFRERVVLGVPVHLQPQLADLVLVVDVLLAPIGLMAALVGTEDAGGWILVLPLLGLIAVFARERQTRIDHALELSRAYRGTTLLLSDVLEADDEYTGSHSWGVVTLALRVADSMGLDGHQRRNVEFGALLHDIGKIAVPKEIINKPGKLNDEEWTVIKMHTVEGERMLKRVGGVLGEVGRIVRSSHERWDGGGYPDGLIGDDIPIESCIVSCCDAFDAMTTDRSYRKAMPLDVALSELEAGAGTQFSPRVANAVIELLRHEAATASAHVGARVELKPPALGGEAPAPGVA